MENKLTIHEKINIRSWFNPLRFSNNGECLRIYRNRPMIGVDEMKKQEVRFNKSYSNYSKHQLFNIKF